jgi:hypothetical protein
MDATTRELLKVLDGAGALTRRLQSMGIDIVPMADEDDDAEYEHPCGTGTCLTSPGMARGNHVVTDPRMMHTHARQDEVRQASGDAVASLVAAWHSRRIG